VAEALRANAAHCDLSVLMQLVSGQWLTGRLVVESDLAVEATIECLEGLPVAARCGRREGLVALYEAFLVPQTQLTFYVQQIASRPPLGELMVLLLEACRRLDEWRMLRDVTLRQTAEAAPGELEALWQRLDGSRTVGATVGELGLARAEVVDPLRRWIEQGAVAATDGPPTPSAPTARSDTFALLARGRAQVRSGDIPGAIASFQEALAIEPHHLLAQQHLLRLRQLHPDLFASQEDS